jgi:hypothetical protein
MRNDRDENLQTRTRAFASNKIIRLELSLYDYEPGSRRFASEHLFRRDEPGNISKPN